MDLPTTIPDALDRAVAQWPGREALVDGDLRLTWSELSDRADEAARAVVASGIEAGDRVGIWSPNIGEWVIAALGIYRAGAAIATMNTRFKGTEGAHNIRTSGARMLFTVTDFLDTDYVALLDAAPDGRPGCLEEIVVFRGPIPDGAVSWGGFLERAASIDVDEVRSRSAAIDGSDMCDIIFTSGTTGVPKGAMMGHAASIRAFWEWGGVVGLREDDRYLIVNPFFHAFGLKAGILACILRGATMIPHPVFDVPSVVQRIQDEAVSMFPGPPAIYQTILNDPDLASKDLSSLRLAVTGAAPVPVEMIEQMRSDIGFETIVTGYGLTESHGVTTMNRHDDPPELISSSDGRALPGVEVVTVDEHGQPTPAGEPGEIWVRGYNLMLGYIGDPEATAEAIDENGWLHTGDIGVLDADGNIKITDRLKDMFITGGFNVYPAEIEAILHTHPDIAQAAVVGVPDERMGEVCAAFVIPRAGASLASDDVISWSRDNMANYKVPRLVRLVDELPLNASNKVLKFELRERAASART
ncbi:MAG: FadD3 family acyl-CoA ligase [Acidimicrobiales bacterium]|nr:FadD3 family acyl-CoA ligase [Acidimicrobiales bacterium]